MKYRSCEMKTIVPGNSARASSRTARDARSRWFVGSSRHRKGAGRTSIRASARRAFSPPDSTRDALVHGVPREEERAEQRPEPRAIGVGRGRLHLLEDRARRVERVELVLGVVVRGDVGAEDPLAVDPAGSAPARIRRRVDLPAPFGPTSAMRSPRSRSRSMPAYTTFGP